MATGLHRRHGLAWLSRGRQDAQQYIPAAGLMVPTAHRLTGVVIALHCRRYAIDADRTARYPSAGPGHTDRTAERRPAGHPRARGPASDARARRAAAAARAARQHAG